MGCGGGGGGGGGEGGSLEGSEPFAFGVGGVVPQRVVVVLVVVVCRLNNRIMKIFACTPFFFNSM